MQLAVVEAVAPTHKTQVDKAVMVVRDRNSSLSNWTTYSNRKSNWWCYKLLWW
jgi:hypothetical protein